jgi:hypothetical protein
MSADLDTQEIEARLQMSDFILCKNIQNLQFQHKRENDVPFMDLLSRPLPSKIRNVEEEYQMWTQTFATRIPQCNESIASRGGNNVAKPYKAPCGYECFSPELMKEWVIEPCKKNTFQNYLVQDDKKICSKSHQLFNNVTKRV